MSIESLTFTPASSQVGTTVTGVVTLSAAAPAGGTVVHLFSSNPAVVSLPASVTVPAKKKSASFAVHTTAPGGAETISASLATVKGTFSTFSLAAISVAGGKALAGQTVAGTVTLTGTVPAGGVAVAIQSSNPSVATTTSAQVTVRPAASGNATGTFTVQAIEAGTAVFTATLAGQSVSGVFEVVGLRSFSVNPSILFDAGGQNEATGTVTLTDTAPIGAVIAIAVTGPAAAFLSVPTSVSILAGQSAVVFPMTVTNPFINGSVTITVTLAGASISETVVLEGAPQ
jgi:hypothetical protein